MFSLGNLTDNSPLLLHSYVDAFFEGKKALVKERLMDSVKVIVDDLFTDMVKQVKETFLPPLKTSLKPEVKQQSTSQAVSISKPVLASAAKPNLDNKKVFHEVKAKPSISGQKRTFSVKDEADSSPVKKVKKNLFDEFGQEEGEAEEDKGNNFDLNEVNTNNNSTSEIPASVDYKENIKVEFEDDTTSATNSTVSRKIQSTKQASISKKTSLSDEKSHTCPEPGCGKSYASKDSLKRHSKSHLKLKPFECMFTPDCTYESDNRFDVVRHVRNVHLKIKAKEKGKEDSEEDGNDDEDSPDVDPAMYVSVKAI